MYNKNEKKSENWKNWIAIFTVGLLLILVYKLLDNFTQIGGMDRNTIFCFNTFFSWTINCVLIIYAM